MAVEEVEQGVWIIKSARVIPENELWLHTPAASGKITQAVEWAEQNPPKESNLDLVLNNAVFQKDWLSLEREEAQAVLAALRKIRQLEWEVYRDKGLRWEAILSRKGPGGGRIYSLRITQQVRAVAYRDGEFLRLLSIHSDRGSAYS